MNESVNPVMVQLARESRGLTQSQLAKKVGIFQGSVSKLETGAIHGKHKELPHPCLIQRISDVTKYPIGFFYDWTITSIQRPISIH